jgi:phage shock protein C
MPQRRRAAGYSPRRITADATMEDRRLTRSDDRLVAGVCAGIADYFGWSVPMTRLVYVLLSVLSVAFPGILVYLILWLVMPARHAR